MSPQVHFQCNIPFLDVVRAELALQAFMAREKIISVLLGFLLAGKFYGTKARGSGNDGVGRIFLTVECALDMFPQM